MSVDHSIEFTDSRMRNSASSFILPMICVIAYYGDGSLNDKEFKSLLIVTDSLIKDDIPNRELAKKEILLEILDNCW